VGLLCRAFDAWWGTSGKRMEVYEGFENFVRRKREALREAERGGVSVLAYPELPLCLSEDESMTSSSMLKHMTKSLDVTGDENCSLLSRLLCRIEETDKSLWAVQRQTSTLAEAHECMKERLGDKNDTSTIDALHSAVVNLQVVLEQKHSKHRAEIDEWRERFEALQKQVTELAASFQSVNREMSVGADACHAETTKTSVEDFRHDVKRLEAMIAADRDEHKLATIRLGTTVDHLAGDLRRALEEKALEDIVVHEQNTNLKVESVAKVNYYNSMQARSRSISKERPWVVRHGSPLISERHGCVLSPGRRASVVVPGNAMAPDGHGSARISEREGVVAIHGRQASVVVPGSAMAPEAMVSEGNCSAMIPDRQGRAMVPDRQGNALIPEGSILIPDRQGSAIIPDRQGSAIIPDRQGSAMIPDRQGSAIIPSRQGSAMIPERQGSAMIPETVVSATVPERQGSFVLPETVVSATVPERQGSFVLPEASELPRGRGISPRRQEILSASTSVRCKSAGDVSACAPQRRMATSDSHVPHVLAHQASACHPGAVPFLPLPQRLPSTRSPTSRRTRKLSTPLVESVHVPRLSGTLTPGDTPRASAQSVRHMFPGRVIRQ